MGDSDDEYDRKRRDKFRGERSTGGDSYRSERRDDRRTGMSGVTGGGGREDWADRNPFRGGGGGGGRPRTDYRDFNRPPRDRYGSPGRDLPPAKRMRGDWGDDLRGAIPRYGGYDPYLMQAWNDHYAHSLHSAYAHAGGASGAGGHAAHSREPPASSTDLQTQPPMMTLKQFLDTQDDGISDSEVLQKYSEYKLEFKRQQLNEFFVAHKDEEWFKNKYHPVDSVKRKEEQLAFLQNRVNVFNELLTNGQIKAVTVDTTQTDPLLRLLDTVVIKLEGGTDDDLKILDEKPRDPPQFPERTFQRKNTEHDDDVIITAVGKKVEKDENEDYQQLQHHKRRQEPEQEEEQEKEEPRVISPQPMRRHMDSDDEENWDDDDDAQLPMKIKEPEPDIKKETNEHDNEDGESQRKSKKSLKRKRTDSNSSSSSSSNDSDSSSSSSSDDEDDSENRDKYNLDDVKVEKKEMDDEPVAEAENETHEKQDEPKAVELDLEKTSEAAAESPAASEHAANEENEQEKDATVAAAAAVEPNKNGHDDDDDGADNASINSPEATSTSAAPADVDVSAEQAEETAAVKETLEDGETKDDKEQENQPETIDLDKVKDGPQPRALHRTSSIFLRNLAPSITKEEIEAICRSYDGYLRVAIADPLAERRWYRRGWVTFKRDVNIKEICWNLNNMRIRDCEMGAIVNRDLSRRVRPVNGMTAHKTIVRADIKLCAKIALNLDEKFKLWEEQNAANATNGVDAESGASTNGDNAAKAVASGSNYGFKSNNPVLQNITDFLIEEASAEEEELLGLSRESKDNDGESLERDPQLIAVLDNLILYLRIVHSVDFYNHCEYPYEDEMPNRCGIIHARGPAPSRITQNDLQDYIKNFETKMQQFLTKATTIDDSDLKSLGAKDTEAEVEKFIQANSQELAKDKWLCPLSGKKFKGPEFIRKHIFNKHLEKVEEVRKEVEYFNNYLRDPKRPQLPEHPGSTKRTNSESSGGAAAGYRPPAYPPPYAPPYAAYAPPMMMPGRGGRGYGGGRRHGGNFSEFRRLMHYRDLDAPQD